MGVPENNNEEMAFGEIMINQGIHSIVPPTLGTLPCTQPVIRGSVEYGDVQCLHHRELCWCYHALPNICCLGCPNNQCDGSHGGSFCLPPHSPSTLGGVPV